MSVATVLDHAISFAELGAFAVDRAGMKKDVTEKNEKSTGKTVQELIIYEPF